MLSSPNTAVKTHDGTGSQVNGRQKLELVDGQAVSFTLLYGQPQEGVHNGRRWIRYTVQTPDGVERSWFVNDDIRQVLNDLARTDKGSRVTVTKNNGTTAIEVVDDKWGTRYFEVSKQGVKVLTDSYNKERNNGNANGHTDSDSSAKTNNYRAAWKSDEVANERAEELARLCDGEAWAGLLTRYGKLYTAALLTSTEAWMTTGTGFQPQQIGASATTIFLRVVETLQGQPPAQQPQPQTQPKGKGSSNDKAKAKAKVTA